MTFVFLISIIKNKYLASKYRIYILLDSKNSRGVDKIKTKYYECFEYLDLMCMKFNVKIYVSNICRRKNKMSQKKNKMSYFCDKLSFFQP